ncbi:MAG: type II toxin-antitoxin system VapC family toxin [Candidatus Bathyarchaeia archaeon]
MIVIDASTLAKFILKEEGWEEVAEQLKAGTISVDHVVKEVANAVWKRFRQGAVSREESKIMLNALNEIRERAVKVEGELPYLDGASEIAFNRDITIYDSLYIAMAKEKGLKLLTSDETQVSVANAENVATILLT